MEIWKIALLPFPHNNQGFIRQRFEGAIAHAFLFLISVFAPIKNYPNHDVCVKCIFISKFLTRRNAGKLQFGLLVFMPLDNAS
ncbi:hypothetical protein T01_7248 [Trichinella spiralis]|uniref:Uncharacterized protein n=1 Tax=Trichinella spiralis TaxID=6334 RepID=A0A0V1BC13_TRISP|nr:hypothetical protein T01_7248 [Trichinella spiralis]